MLIVQVTCIFRQILLVTVILIVYAILELLVTILLGAKLVPNFVLMDT